MATAAGNLDESAVEEVRGEADSNGIERQATSGGDCDYSDDDAENQEEDEDHIGDDVDDDDEESDRDDDGDNNASESEASDTSDDDEGGGGLSSLEKRRFERIRRNKEVLSRLGLADLKPMAKPKQQRIRDKKEIDPGDVRKSSRSKQDVNYADMPARFVVEDPETVRDPAPKKNRSGERDKDKRMERFIYDEFLRLRSSQKNDLKMAEKKFRFVQLEQRFAARAASAATRRVTRKQSVQNVCAALESEKLQYGKSLREILQDIDRRQVEIQVALRDFDYKYMSPDRLEHLEKQRLEHERKLEMIDAMNGFPNVLKEAVHHLNHLLVERAPKDPLPPRQSDRTQRDSSDGKKGRTAVPVSPESDETINAGEWQNLAAVIAAEKTSEIIDSSRSAPDEADDSNADPARAKVSKKGGLRRKNTNVGGWVSPTFSSQIDRSWLAGDAYDWKLNLSTYVPQAGDIILYYPSGHRDFLTQHPDVLGKKLRSKARMPLWERARKEKTKGRSPEDPDTNAPSERVESAAPNQKQSEWFNDEWLAGVDNKLGDYPLICRVERTHAEFPPHPEVESMVVAEEGVRKVVFKQSKSNKKSKKWNPPLRLVVVLKPMTPLIPPDRDDSSCCHPALSPPPIFHVVTFPSRCAPFIIPFGFGYRISHSLRLGGMVKSRGENQFCGFVTSFLSMDSYGSGRIEDNASRIGGMLAFLKGEGAATLLSSLESSLLQANGPKLNLPLAEAGIVIDTMATRTTCSASTAALTKNEVEGCLITLIRETLPLWKGVSVVLEGGRFVSVSPWDVESFTLSSPSGGAYAALTGHVLAGNGLMYYIDEAVRAKIECSLEDFAKRNEDSHVFWDSVTDDLAPSYSCAVPQGMCFQRIMRRLSHRKAPGEERAYPYYRTLDSLLNDVGSILDNCLLYNSADSDIVLQGFRVIADATKLIEEVVSRHQKERTAREKADEERRRKITLQYNAAACIQSNTTVAHFVEGKNQKSRRSSHSAHEQKMQGPFAVALNRSWIERTDRDTSWSSSDDSTHTSEVTRTAWVPQSGDAVLYSRLLHSEFIKGHQESLLTEQCNLPQFVLQSGTAISDANVPPAGRLPRIGNTVAPVMGDNEASPLDVMERVHRPIGNTSRPPASASPWPDRPVAEIRLDDSSSLTTVHMNAVSSQLTGSTVEADFYYKSEAETNKPADVDESLADSIHSQLLVGRVVWVRRAFPRNPSKRDVENDTFDVRSPLLSLGICFDYPWSRGQQTHMVYWRPCVISNLSGAPDNCSCPSCGCQSSFGFLLPAWLYRSSKAESFSRRTVLLPDKVSIDSQSFFSRPSGLDRDTISAINRCFNALKRRCLAGIPPDFVPENFNIQCVKEGWRPPSKTPFKTLPTFEYLFGNDTIGDVDRASNRAVAQNRKSENLEEQEKSVTALAEIHYIPPYSKAPSASKSNMIKGREKKQSGSSFEESMCPSPKLSLELIQQRLRNGYYRQKMGLVDDMQEAYVSSVLLVLSRQSSTKFGPCFSLKKFTKSLLKRGTTKTPCSKKEGKMAVNDGPLDGLPQGRNEEDGRVRNVLMVRSLYAMALASVSATRFFECIFGTSPKKGATTRRREPSAQHHRFMAARQKLSLILTALPRDPAFNRGRAKSLRGASASGNQEGYVFPSVKIKIVSSPMSADKYDELPPIVFSHQDYANLDGLVRCFFGKPGRMNACGRCQVSRRSMLSCRVQRGHLNQDFNWDSIMAGVGGIEGLLYTLKYGNPPPLTSSEAQPQAVQVSGEPPSDLTCRSDTSLQHDAAKAEEDAAKDKQALRLLASASRALLLAEMLLASAKKAAELPPRLSDEFIRNSFPIDPADGHYNYCSICGLSGDVICCEKCPVVMHARCAGSEHVPEGDWFCPKCNSSDTKESKIDKTTEVPGKVTAAIVHVDDARVRCGELRNKESRASSVNDSTQAEEDAATGLGRKAGISGEATKGEGTNNADSDVVSQTPDNNDKDNLNLPLEVMHGELDTLLTELRDYRHAQNPVRNRKKDDKEEEHQNERTEKVADEKGSVYDREQVSNGDNVIAGKKSTTTMLRRTSVAASERPTDENPQVSEKGEEPQAIGIGSKVSKDFGENGRFLGVVKALPCDDYPFYNIRYEDGDEEDMDEGELREVLIFIKPPRKRKAILGDEETPHKRGRTSIQGGSADYSDGKSQSARFSASFLETISPPRPAGSKIESKPGFRSFKPGVRVVPKKLRRQGKTGTIVRSIDRHTWEVRFDDGRKRGPFKSQQLSYLEDVASGFDDLVEPSTAGNVMHLCKGVRVFPRKGEWRDKIGTIVKEVSKFTWEVKFDDGIDRGTFKSLQLTFADAGALARVENAVEAHDEDQHTSSPNTGQIVEFKAGVRVVPKKNVYKFKGATIVRSAGRHKWELKFDDGVDRGTFKTQQLCHLDNNQILPLLDVDTADGVKKEFKVGVRVLPKKRVYQDKLATIIRSCGNHTWELKFDDGVDRGTFTSQQLAYIADSERDAVASTSNAHMNFKAGVRVVPKSMKYEGKLGTIVKSVGPEQWTVKFDDGEQPGTFTSQQLAFAHSIPAIDEDAKSDSHGTGQADDMLKASNEVDGGQRRRRGRPRKSEKLVAPQVIPAIGKDAKSDFSDTLQVDDMAKASHAVDGGQRRRRGRPSKTETLVALAEALSNTGGKSRAQNSPAVVETRTTPRKRERDRNTTTEPPIGVGGEGAEAAQRTKRLRTRSSFS